MKRIIFLVLFMGVLCCGFLCAQDEGFGLGVVIGEPTGINFKAWLGYKTAFVGAAAWSFVHEKSWHIHFDYIAHDFKLIKLEEGHLPVYYGIGFRVKTQTRTQYGIRIPLGIVYMLEEAPLDIFAEFVPVFDLSPKTDFYFNGGIGIRYYF